MRQTLQIGILPKFIVVVFIERITLEAERVTIKIYKAEGRSYRWINKANKIKTRLARYYSTYCMETKNVCKCKMNETTEQA